MGRTSDYKLVLLAGGFPAGLNTLAAAEDLKPDETPAGYGFAITTDGSLSKATAPTGTSRIQRSITITEGGASIPYYWHFRRLWNITNRTASTASNILTFGAPDYDAVFYPQTSGRIHFDEDSNAILSIAPVVPDSMFVAKSTGGYLLGNASDNRAFFSRTDLIQEMRTAAAAQMIVVDGVVYVTNSDGLIALDGAKSAEISQTIRASRASLASLALTADYERKWIVCGSTFVYDAVRQKWFQYSGSSFLFTSRVLHNPDYSPLSVDRLIFVIDHTYVTDGNLKYRVKYDDTAWSKEYTVELPYQEEQYSAVSDTMELNQSCRRFQIKITSLSSNVAIRQILVDAQGYNFDDYST